GPSGRGWVRTASCEVPLDWLAAPHRVAAVEALVAGAIPDGDVAARIAKWCVTRELSQELVLRGGGRALWRPSVEELLLRLGGGRWAGRLRARLGAHRGRGRGRRRLGSDVRQVVASEIFNTQRAEDVVDDAGRELHSVVTLHRALRLEPREDELLHECLERNAVLQRDRDQ